MPIIPVQAIIAVVVAIAAALGIGLGITQSESSDRSSLRADGSSEITRPAQPKVLKLLPASAVKANPEQATEILNAAWLPVPDYKKTPIAFKERNGVFVTTTKACNGFGVGIKPQPGTAAYTFEPQATTEMYCGGATEYETAIFEAFAQGTHFAVEPTEGELKTVYVVGPQGALQLRKTTSADQAKPGFTGMLVDLPASAQRATKAQLDGFLAAKWKTEPNFNNGAIWFTHVKYEFPVAGVTNTGQKVSSDQEFYLVEGAPCNGFGVGIVAVEIDKLDTISLGVTKKACSFPGYALEDATNYEVSVGAAFRDATGVYFEGADTAYVAGPKGALKLTRVQ